MITLFDENKGGLVPIYRDLNPKNKILKVGDTESNLENVVADEVWVPVAGKRGWIAVTCDQKLIVKYSQWEFVVASKVRMVTLFGAGHLALPELDRTLRPAWGNLPYFYHNYEPPWHNIIEYNQGNSTYTFYDKSQISVDTLWRRDLAHRWGKNK